MRQVFRLLRRKHPRLYRIFECSLCKLHKLFRSIPPKQGHTDIHDDAISETNEKDKVSFLSFEGVSPRSYNIFFRKAGKVKNTKGIAIDIVLENEPVVSKQFLDSYRDIEDKVSERALKRLDLNPQK